ncbi:M56 family metallopeptidase [Nonomuraea sp. NPDC051941]|uniref:M56 family metallopeptidase n=1 Tax=Nonomuraea sp. NPDC051941 TaxID=3364373 RepID=UPI0037CA633D
MILYGLRHRPLPLAIVLALIAIRLLWSPSPELGMNMTMAECWGLAFAIVAGMSIVSIAARTTWLAWQSARSLARLPRTAFAARTALLTTEEPLAFCAGMLRPRVYVSAGLAKRLSDDELRAVLCHEAAHARRRDPLRRVLLSAATDVLFFLPLLRWAARVQKERAELCADRAAIEQVGARHVAGALLAMEGRTAPAGVAAFDGSAAARVAQLVGDAPPSHRISLGLVGLSLAGLAAATSLMMCVGQGLWMFVTTWGL